MGTPWERRGLFNWESKLRKTSYFGIYTFNNFREFLGFVVRTQQKIVKIKLILNYIIFGIMKTKLNNNYGVVYVWLLWNTVYLNFENDID